MWLALDVENSSFTSFPKIQSSRRYSESNFIILKFCAALYERRFWSVLVQSNTFGRRNITELFLGGNGTNYMQRCFTLWAKSVSMCAYLHRHVSFRRVYFATVCACRTRVHNIHTWIGEKFRFRVVSQNSVLRQNLGASILKNLLLSVNICELLSPLLSPLFKWILWISCFENPFQFFVFWYHVDSNQFEIFGRFGDVYTYNITLWEGFDTAIFTQRIPQEIAGDFDLFASKCVMPVFKFSNSNFSQREKPCECRNLQYVCVVEVQTQNFTWST